MSKVRSTSKKSRSAGKPQTSMVDDDLAQVMDMMMDKPLTTYVAAVSSMDDSATAETVALKTSKKASKAKTAFDEMDDTAESAPSKPIKRTTKANLSLLPKDIAPQTAKPSKIDKKVVALNKVGQAMTKIVSKKDKLKAKKQSLLNHLDVTISAPQRAKEEQRRALQLAKSFSFDSLSASLDAIDTASPSSTKANPALAVLQGAGQWKATKKSLKGLESDKEKIKQVIDHPAFQQNPTTALQQHLTNQMAMMRHMEAQAAPAAQRAGQKLDKNTKAQKQQYSKLINKKESLASSMKRK